MQSLAAGCHSSTTLARAITRAPLVAASNASDGRVRQSVHVDDIAQEVEGSEDESVQVLSAVGKTLTSELQYQGFNMSTKSLVCNTSKRISNSLVQFFKLRGIK